MYAYFFCCSVNTRYFTLYNGTFPVCPQQCTGACKCHVIVVVFRLRVQKLTPTELRLFATQCGITIISHHSQTHSLLLTIILCKHKTIINDHMQAHCNQQQSCASTLSLTTIMYRYPGIIKNHVQAHYYYQKSCASTVAL